MQFSPALMAEFSRVTVNGMQFYRWHGGYSAWLDFIRRARGDASPGGKAFARVTQGDADHHFGDWSGVNQAPDSILAQGFYTTAREEFFKASAKLETDRYIPGALKPAVAGGAWIVPLVLAGNPMPARIRQRSKLPPVNLDLAVNVWVGVKWEDITRSMARIARAAWNYIEAGGAVSITANYVHHFSHAQDGCKGVVVSIQVPVTNMAAFASAASTQEYRGFTMAFASQGLSPNVGDGLPLCKWNRPGLLHITGRPADDDKALAAFKIL